MQLNNKFKTGLIICACAIATYVFFWIVAYAMRAILPYRSLIPSIIADVVLAFLSFYYIRRLRIDCFVPTTKATAKRSLKIGVGILIVWFIGQLLASALYYNFGDPSYDTYDQVMGSISFMSIISSCIFAPIAEELYYRGFVFRGLANVMNPLVAALISSMFFAISHGTLVHLPVTFAFGLGSCALLFATGNIGFSIVLHVAANALSFVIPLLPVPQFFVNPVFDSVIYGVGIAIICLYIHRAKPTTKALIEKEITNVRYN